MPGFTLELTSKASPDKVFQVAALDAHFVFPKILPEVVSGATLLHGDGGVGTVKLIEFTDAVPYDFFKERVDLLDKENLEYTQSWIEGGLLGAKLESASFNVKVRPAADGGSVLKLTTDYRTKSGVELTEEELEAEKEDFLGVFQAVEAYVLANPDA